MMSVPMMICNLVFVLLFLSLHACNARQLVGVVIKKESVERLHFPNKDNEKSRLGRVLDPSKAQDSVRGEISNGASSKEDIINNKKPSSSGEESDSSLVSVSWKVPHKRKQQQQQQPGFNLDYSPPKTHPPVHN